MVKCQSLSFLWTVRRDNSPSSKNDMYTSSVNSSCCKSIRNLILASCCCSNLSTPTFRRRQSVKPHILILLKHRTRIPEKNSLPYCGRSSSLTESLYYLLFLAWLTVPQNCREFIYSYFIKIT